MNKLEGGSTIEKEPGKFEKLESLFGKNFNPEKTIKLEKDVDQDNNQIELPNQEFFWTELKDPETGEVIEGKVYLPKDGKVDKVLIVAPGYRGDFVLQEAQYAKDFAIDGRAMIVLRHNGLRVQGDDVKNYVHCPEKQQFGEQKDQRYLGKEDFSFETSSREVLVALKAISDKIDDLKKIDILGHSFGARTAIESVTEAKKHAQSNENIKKLVDKIDNLIVMGAWLETRKEMLEPYLEYFKGEEEGDYFRNLNGEKFFEEILKSAERTKRITTKDFPENMRFIGIHSVSDGDINLEGEVFPFFNQIKDIKRKGSIILKDLKEIIPSRIGGRETETHDYPISQAREWIKLAIDKKNE
jgi:hypothetical protein